MDAGEGDGEPEERGEKLAQANFELSVDLRPRRVVIRASGHTRGSMWRDKIEIVECAVRAAHDMAKFVVELPTKTESHVSYNMEEKPFKDFSQ